MPDFKQKKTEQDIDLASLFIIIGNGLKKITAFVFNIIIETLFFLKKKIVLLLIPTLIGALFGFYLEKKGAQKYESNLYVIPNFESTTQLYENITSYNNQLYQGKYEDISKSFSISLDEAKSLRSFRIVPVVNTEDIVNRYAKEIDSAFVGQNTEYSFSDYKKNFKKTNYKTHKITVISTKNDIFKKLTSPIVSSISNNKFLSKRKEASNKGMINKSIFLDKKLGQIDSIIKTNYITIPKQGIPNTSGVNINYSQESQKDNDINKLLNTNLVIKNHLIETKSYIYERSNVINIVSNFQDIGSKIKILKKGNKVYKYTILLFLISLSVILLLSINRYLNNYKNIN